MILFEERNADPPSASCVAGARVAALALAIVLTLAGCASYRASPLPSDDALLSMPSAADLASLTPVAHPRLAPEPLDLGKPLNELDAARLALILSPELAAQRSQAGVAEAQLFAAGLLPDPQLSLSVDHPDVLGLVNGLSGGIALDLASLFTRHARVEGSRLALEKVRSDVAWSEWLAINQVRTLSRRASFLERQLKVAEDAAAAAKKIYDLSTTNMRRGDANLDATALYQVGFLDAQDRSLMLRRNLSQTRQQLNATIGLPPDYALALAAPPETRDAKQFDPDALARIALRQRFDLQALRSGYLAQEAGLRRALRASIPLPQLSLNRTRDTSAIWTRGMAMTLSLPLWNRGRGDIRIETATRGQLATEYSARVYQTRSDIAAARADLDAIDAERKALAAELPILEHSADVIGNAARNGDVSLVTYETVRATLLDKRLALLALEQAQSEGEIVLETAVGDYLPDSP